jgi:hypothetical protein
LPLIERVINGFYFEIGEAAPGMIRIAAFVTATKPNLTSNPVPNEPVRIRALQEMFRRLSKLKEYAVGMVDRRPIDLKAQGADVLVTGIRADISRKDVTQITIKDIVSLIEKSLVQPVF